MHIVIIGAGISGLTCAYRLTRKAAELGRDVRITVLEASSRVGGKLESQRDDGILFEHAANGWLRSRAAIEGLAQELALTLDTPKPAAKNRFIMRGGKLYALRANPFLLATTGLVGLRGKWRLAREPWIAQRRLDGDESVASFARRRLGPEAYATLIDPVVSGVFAGDPETMSLASAFPSLHALEQKHGSLVRGLWAERGQNKGPRGLTAPQGGMAELPRALAKQLRDAPRTNAPVKRIQSRYMGGYHVDFADESVNAEHVVLALPAPQAAELLAPNDAMLAAELEGIPYAPVATVGLGFRRADIAHPLDGFGFLVPHQEGRDILGCVFESSVYPNRAPDDQVMLRVMIGGARRPELVLERSESELVELAQRELQTTLGLRGAPTFAQAVRHTQGIPQYVLGHKERLARIQEQLGRLPGGLWLLGNAYEGVSLNDCVLAAERLAERILERGPSA